MSVSFNYTVNDIHSNFAEKDYMRGAAYVQQGRVVDVTFTGSGKLFARVQGSEKNPYEVVVDIVDGHTRKELHGYCSCPLGFGCKHIIAALLEGIKLLPSVSTSTNVIPLHATLAVSPAEPPLDEELKTWLESLNKPQKKSAGDAGKILIYLIAPPWNKNAFTVSAVSTSILKKGGFSTTKKPYRLEQLESYSRAQYIQDDDVAILRLISAIINHFEWCNDSYNIPMSAEGEVLLKMLIATGRCYLPDAAAPEEALSMGEKRKAAISWKTDATGLQKVSIAVEGVRFPIFLALQPPYYICPASKTVGVMDTGLPDRQAALMLRVPAIRPAQVEVFSKKLASVVGDIPELLPAILPIRTIDVQPVPCLKLGVVSLQPQQSSGWRTQPSGAAVTVPVAAVMFDYGGKKLAWQDSVEKISRFKNGEVLAMPRNIASEREVMDHLRSLGLSLTLQAVRPYYAMKQSDAPFITIGSATENFHKDATLPQKWENFMQEEVPRLKELGWKITLEKNFPYNIVEADDEWYGKVEEGSGVDWFGVELGVTIGGERLNLVPILLNLLKKGDDIFDRIANLPDKTPLLLSLGDGRRLALPPERVRILLATLQHLFSFQEQLDDNGHLKMQGVDAALLAEMEAAADSLNMRWFGGDKIRGLGRRLKEFTAISPVVLPDMFQGKLRPYQQEGVNWLQFLREYDLAGILADDMGLGKTVQLLAHIATEKAANRLTHPFLVIAPTSLMVNWKMEAARFVPNLKVLILHGSDRKAHFQDIPHYDIVLTTYPLLPRDKDVLLTYSYHTVVLDEAQTIKNARAKLTQIAYQLKAEHRLCMTGTPLENHLGELWSLFNFLLPGYLGTMKQFGSLFRTPIEKGGDVARSQTLARRVKPFILRRTKQEVVTELPPKTEMVRMVELEGEQRDLYETIRVSMHEKIRQEIAAHGMDKSHIIVLDALLKLRQACCDPALLKIDAAKNIVESAKRLELMNMLTAMVEEGRKILLFSQFTSMLALIEEQLKQLSIPYVILTGKTIDRETPVRNFQEGKVPLFLISLKAGGTGLNLTAADTVIHYDPWWNPAAENQATDRAYRIGQDKPVFVYKLITKGTVEEKIIEMQAKKRALMDSLFDTAGKASSRLTVNDIQTLFEPLEQLS